MASRLRGRRLLALLLAAGLAAGPASGLAAGPDESPDRLNRDYLKKLRLDVGAALTAPLHWTGSDFLAFGLLAGTAGLFYANDADVSARIEKLKTPAEPDRAVTLLGNGLFLTGFSAALYLAGEAFASPDVRRTALVSFESFVAASIAVTLLKIAAGRARPYADEGPARFHPLAFTGRHMSFPSGDAAGAFAVASVIAARTDGILAGILAYGLAGLVAIDRVHDDKHWPSDIFVGSALGLLIGHKMARLNEGGGRPGPTVALVPSRLGPGLAVEIAF